MTDLLGITFSDHDLPAISNWCLERPADEPFTYIVTPNADHLSRLSDDPSLLKIYRSAELCLLDSRFLAHLARLLRLPAPPVCTGADLIATLLTAINNAGRRVTVVGLSASAMVRLRQKFPAIQFTHTNPPMGFINHPHERAAAISFCLRHPADFVCLAVGSPQQEILAAALASTQGVRGIGLCIGAALEFSAGTKKRAPLWMQRAGLEWAWRLLIEPRRMARRYLHDDPAVILALCRAALRRTRR